MQIEDREGNIKYITAGNLEELVTAVADVVVQGYRLSSKNQYRAAGSFGHYTCGLEKIEEEQEQEAPSEKQETVPSSAETNDDVESETKPKRGRPKKSEE